MPCDTIQTSTVEFRLENTDIELLKLAMKECGYRLSGVDTRELNFIRNRDYAVFRDGTMTITTSTGKSEGEMISEVKRAYSTQVVKSTAKRFGWQIKENGPNRFQVSKGR